MWLKHVVVRCGPHPEHLRRQWGTNSVTEWYASWYLAAQAKVAKWYTEWLAAIDPATLPRQAQTGSEQTGPEWSRGYKLTDTAAREMKMKMKK